jgi:hypothetical protein
VFSVVDVADGGASARKEVGSGAKHGRSRVGLSFNLGITDNAVVTLWELESESEKEFGINKRLH